MRLLALISLFGAVCNAQTFTPQTSHTGESLRGISTVSSSVAWASGTHGTYLHTTDGGQTWIPAHVPGAEQLDFRDVEAFSAEEAYLLSAGPGDQSRIYHTADAGRHWTLQFTNTEPKGFYDCMAFWDREHGIALGDPLDGRFELLTTSDAGAHWTPLPEKSRPASIGAEGAFAASGTCIAVQGSQRVWFATGGPVARVFRSTDRGQTWQVSETPITHGTPSSGIFSITFRDAQHGLIAGGDYQHPDADGPNLATTSDGGATWQLINLHPQFYFSAIGPLGESAGTFLAVGSTHSLTADVEHVATARSFETNLNALSVMPSGDALAAGPKGQIVRWSPRP